MASYLVAFAKLKDLTALKQYSEAAQPTLLQAGGKIVARGSVAPLAGSLAADTCLIASFPTSEALTAWYQSPGYQALIPLRDKAFQPTFLVLNEVS